MISSHFGRHRVASGVGELDKLLGGLYIGDNVVWHDDSGSLASVFCLNLMQASQAQNKPVIYVSFDRSPRNLLDKLGSLTENPLLTILDCFTWGKGAGSDVFLRFYYENKTEWPCRIIRVDEPRQPNHVMDALNGVHSGMSDDVRFVFESVTGMQELWGGEDTILKFYTHSCPRLYELNAVAYWIMEKNAHSTRLRAQINQIAQVAIDLSIKRGSTSLAILKAEGRGMDNLHKPYNYWTKELNVSFEEERKSSRGIELGARLREVRTKRGLSQTELAKLVGVTPSTISQIESNLIYPSLPALLKMAEVLSVDVSSFFQEKMNVARRLVFSPNESSEIKLSDMPEGALVAHLLIPVDFDAQAEPYLIELSPDSKLPSHFFIHKGEEFGYMLSGKLKMFVDKAVYNLKPGDVVFLTSEMPTQWYNPGPGVARLLWLKVK